MRTFSFQSTLKGNMIEIPEQFVRIMPRQVLVTIQSGEENGGKARRDSHLLYELRAEAAERGFLSDDEIEREIQAARAESCRLDTGVETWYACRQGEDYGSNSIGSRHGEPIAD